MNNEIYMYMYINLCYMYKMMDLVIDIDSMKILAPEAGINGKDK